MGTIATHRPVLLICAIISRYCDAFDWATEKMIETYGPIALQSDRFDFVETSFYTASMGTDLKKQFVAFESLVEPATLPTVKLNTNDWEEAYDSSHDHPESRPLNLDPGYITEAKLVLATTKDRDHRLFLSDGIYAEVTLHWHKGQWRKSPWTYPDYQREDFQAFFTKCRERLRTLYQREKAN